MNILSKPRHLHKLVRLAIIFTAGVCNHAGATHYTIEYFPIPPGATSAHVSAINSSGQMAGTSFNTGSFWERLPAIWAADGTVTELPAIQIYNYAEDINDTGQVAVSAAPESGPSGNGYVLFKGVKTIIPPLPGGNPNSVSVAGINRLGQVVGTSVTASGAQHAYLYTNGTSIDLGTLPGYVQIFATGVNDAGQVVGFTSNNGTDIGGFKPNRAFLWSNGVLTDLGSLRGYDGFVAGSINNKGQVLGNAHNSSSGAEITFLWNNGVMQALPGTSNDFHANAINDLGQIVGTLRTGGPALWQNGVVEDLSNHFDRPLSSAGAINNLGQIAGAVSTINGNQLIFRLTPVVPPLIDGFWPASGVTNTGVLLFGKGFRVASGKNPIVKFNNGTLLAPIVQIVAPDLLFVLQPAGTTVGKITIETASGIVTSSTDYNVIQAGLKINGIWPREVKVGAFSFVFGGGFSLSPGTNKVDVNGVPAPIVQVLDATFLGYLVPAGATSGPVHVTAGGVTATSPLNLVILP